jgi:hypothetical protein
LPIYSSTTTRAITIVSSEINFHAVYAQEELYGGSYLGVQQDSLSNSVTNYDPSYVNATLGIRLYVACLNQSWYDYFLVENSLAEVAIIIGLYQEIQLAVQMLTEQAQMRPHSFAH